MRSGAAGGHLVVTGHIPPTVLSVSSLGGTHCWFQLVRSGRMMILMSESLLEAFRLDQPRANDLVGNPLLIAGSGGGFEAVIVVRVLAGTVRCLSRPP